MTIKKENMNDQPNSTNHPWTLKGKTAIVTGASKGIGKATTETFLQLGAEVLFLARSEELIWEAEQQYQAQGHRAYAWWWTSVKQPPVKSLSKKPKNCGAKWIY